MKNSIYFVGAASGFKRQCNVSKRGEGQLYVGPGFTDMTVAAETIIFIGPGCRAHMEIHDGKIMLQPVSKNLLLKLIRDNFRNGRRA